MTPVWTTTSGLPSGEIVIWTGRHVGLLRDGLDEWHSGLIDLYARLDAAPELIVIDALSFPWDSMRAQDRDIPLVVVLPPELDDSTATAQVLGDVLIRHVTAHDRLIEGRPDVRAELSKAYGLPSSVWLPVKSGKIEDVMEALRLHARSRLVEIASDIGTFLVPEGDLVTQQLREYGAHQRGDLNALMSVLRHDDVVLDIGAHVGTFAIPLARHLGPSGQVVAIEPHPDVFRLLCQNVELNGLDARIETQQVLLAAPGSLPRSPVLMSGNTGGTWFQEASASDAAALAATTIDAWMEARADPVGPSVIKVDVEGAELEVLRGADITIRAKRPVLMVEVSRTQLDRHGASVRQLDRWFSQQDYDLYVSSGTRNTAGTGFLLEPLGSLADYQESVFDVIAVPRESDRRPEAVQ